MSKHKLGTTAGQKEKLDQLLREAEVTSDVWQRGYDAGQLQRYVDALARGLPISIDVPLAPPEGGRIHTLTVKVQQDCEWQEAVNVAGPNTPDYYDIREVGSLYLPTGGGLVDEELVLLNYSAGDGGWYKAIAWAEQVHLRHTGPRHVFAVGEQHPNFHRMVGINPTYVVETTGCTFSDARRACCVWWDGASREAALRRVGFSGNDNAWFVFRR